MNQNQKGISETNKTISFQKHYFVFDIFYIILLGFLLWTTTYAFAGKPVKPDPISDTANVSLENVLGHSQIESIAISPDSQYIVIPGRGCLTIWTMLEDESTVTLNYQPNPITNQLFVDNEDPIIQSADIIPLSNPQTIDTHLIAYGVSNMLNSVAYIGNESYGIVKLMGWPSGEVITLGYHDLPIDKVIFSPDGKYLASFSEDATVKVWDLANKQLVYTYTNHNTGVKLGDFLSSGDSYFIVSASKDGELNLWNALTGENKFTISNSDPFSFLTFLDDGINIGTIDKTGKFSIIDFNGNISYSGAVEAKYGIGALSSNGKTLVYITETQIDDPETPEQDYEYTLIKRNITDNELENEFPLKSFIFNPGMYGPIIETFGFTPDSNSLFTGGYHGLLSWDLNHNMKNNLTIDLGDPVGVLPEDDYGTYYGQHIVRELKTSNNGNYCLSSGYLSYILWDLLTGKELIHLPRISNPIRQSMAFSSSDQFFAIAHPKQVDVYEINAGQVSPKQSYSIENTEITSITFLNNDLLIGTNDGYVYHTGTEYAENLQILFRVSYNVTRKSVGYPSISLIAVSGNDEKVAIGFASKVKIYETAHWSSLKEIECNYTLTDLEFDPIDFNNLLAVNTSTMIIDAETGTIPYKTPGFFGDCFSSDGKYILGSYNEQNIGLWNYKESKFMTWFACASRYIHVDRIPSSELNSYNIFSSGFDGLIKNWNFSITSYSNLKR